MCLTNIISNDGICGMHVGAVAPTGIFLGIKSIILHPLLKLNNFKSTNYFKPSSIINSLVRKTFILFFEYVF